MKIAVIGATGYVGRHLVQEALARGHDVTALSRHAEILPEQPGLQRINHDLLQDARATGARLSGHAAILYAYNPQRGSTAPDIYQQHVRGHQALLDAMAYSDCKRLLCVGGAASLKLASGEEFIDTPQFPPQFEANKPSIRGTRQLYYLLQEHSELDWVFLSPSALLVEGERTGRYRTGTDYLLYNSDGLSTISLQDYAVAMLDETEKPAHHRQRFTVGY
jgi:putative NADH-flavin reductase